MAIVEQNISKTFLRTTVHFRSHLLHNPIHTPKSIDPNNSLGHFFASVRPFVVFLFFFGFSASLLSCFAASSLFCFSAFLIVCVSAFLLLCFSAFLLLCFSASLLVCFCFYVFPCFSVSPFFLLFCFVCVLYWPFCFLLLL